MTYKAQNLAEAKNQLELLESLCVNANKSVEIVKSHLTGNRSLGYNPFYTELKDRQQRELEALMIRKKAVELRVTELTPPPPPPLLQVINRTSYRPERVITQHPPINWTEVRLQLN